MPVGFFCSNIYKIEMLKTFMVKEVDNSFGVVSFIFGVLSVLSILTFTGFIAGLVLGVLALIFGLIQRSRMKTGWANWGIAFGLIGLVLNLWFIFKVIATLKVVLDQIRQVQGSGALGY